MTTPGSSRHTPGRGLRMGIVAAVAVSIPVVLWWQVLDLDLGRGMAVVSYFPTAMFGWLMSKGRKPLWAIFWSTLGGAVWPAVLAANLLKGPNGDWVIPIVSVWFPLSFVLGPIAGLYVSLAFRIAGLKGKPAEPEAMTTPGSSMLAPGRRLRTGIVAAVAVSIPVVLWWQVVELDEEGVVIGMVAGSYFLTAMFGWLVSKGRKPLWAIFWSTLGGIVWPAVMVAIVFRGGGGPYAGWGLPFLAVCFVAGFVLGPIAGLYVSLAFWIAGLKGKPTKQVVVEV